MKISDHRICIIVPCFNEFNRIDSASFLSFLDANPEFDLCFVNDGSTDNTIEKLKEIKSGNTHRCEIINPGFNAGKAEAVRLGINSIYLQNRHQYIGYWDADLSTPLQECKMMIDYASNYGDYKMIIGSRIKRLGADIRRSPKRFYLSRLFATVASIMLGLPVYDTQCGAKIIHRDIIEFTFDRQFKSKWLFDIEIIARLISHFGTATAKNLIMEVPLQIWIEKGNSRISFFYLLKAPFEMYSIRKLYGLGKS